MRLRYSVTDILPVMNSRNILPAEAFAILQEGIPFSRSIPCVTLPLDVALPLFSPAALFHRHLELFHETGHAPTPEHPLVKAWVSGTSAPAAVSRSDYLAIMMQRGKMMLPGVRDLLRKRASGA